MTTQPGISYAGVPRNSSDETLAFLRDGHYSEASKSTTTAQIAPCIGEDQGTHQPVQWRISPYTPMSMVSLFLSGVLVAIGHHLFYLRFEYNGFILRTMEHLDTSVRRGLSDMGRLSLFLRGHCLLDRWLSLTNKSCGSICGTKPTAFSLLMQFSRLHMIH
jgi:hypothetical protein